MEGLDLSFLNDLYASSDGAPPPPPPGGAPPSPSRCPSPSGSPRKSPRPLLIPSPPQPRPTLTHMGSSSRRNVHGDRHRRSGLNRSVAFGDVRSSLRGSLRGIEEHNVISVDPAPTPTDRRLLIASLEHEAVEDEAESTLLEVLERRQVAIDSQDHAVRSNSHRRHRSNYSSIDLLNLEGTSMQRPTSATSSSEAVQPLSMPGLPSRSSSNERSKRVLPGHRPTSPSEAVQPSSRPGLPSRSSSNERSRRVLPGHRPTRSVAVGFDWALDSHELLGNLSLSADQLEEEPNGSTEKRDSFPAQLQTAPSFINRRHKRAVSSLPVGFGNGMSDSSPSPGLSAPGERARHVAFKMKSLAANNMEDLTRASGEGELFGLMNIMEAHRENDNQSIGSGQRSRGRASESKGGQSIASATRSADNSGFSGNGNRGFRSQRPFSGTSSSPLSGVENWLRAAEHLHELGQIPEDREDREEKEDSDFTDLNNNFLSQVAESHPDIPTVYSEDKVEMTKGEACGVNEQTPMIPQRNRPIMTSAERGLIHRWSFTGPAANSRFNKLLLWWCELRKQMKIFAVAFDAHYVKDRVWSFFQNEISLFVVPALAISAFFYYSLNNPTFLVVSTDASISWWILFVIRHYLTLQLAYMSEYVFVDVLAMRTLFSSELVGPLATLCAITSKGWPYTFTLWGVFNLLFIQGKTNTGNEVYDHWLYFTGMEMFTPENPSGGVVESDTYREILLSVIIVGVATSLKSTLMALFLGKRVYVHYKPRLEKVMESMILLNEVSDLGEAIDDFEFAKVDRPNEADQNGSKRFGSSRQSTQLRDKIRTSTMIDVIQKQKTGSTDADSSEDEGSEEASEESTESTRWNRLRAGSDSSGEAEPLVKAPNLEALEKILSPSNKSLDPGAAILPPSKNAVNTGAENAAWLAGTQEDLFGEELLTAESDEPPITVVDEPVQAHLGNRSTTTHIKSLLDNWEEPVNKQDKMADPTIQDILMFRKASTFLEDMHPFGSSFGPAFTRDSCIKSSKSLYKRLLSLSPGSPVLPFDVIGVLAYNMDGTFDAEKARSLVRLFRPDKFDEVSLVHFVQSCDGIYKKIRYLRASIGNSSQIDNVLESIFNGLFGFLLALIVMSILELNPWALLVSLSTVLVSFAFALGPSAAKLIEGMTMIAVRRPFDLGDRISIVNCTGAPDNSGDPGYHDTWIVEDINLFTTTLRLSRSNEVSTVNNGSIANTRIVNHGRSRNALVNILLPMRIDATHDQVQVVETVLQQYIQDNPRVWASLVNFRITKIDPAQALIVYSARVQHVKSWQDILPILQARGDLENFCTEILMKLDIHYDGCAMDQDVYIKELPDQQQMFGEAAPFPRI